MMNRSLAKVISKQYTMLAAVLILLAGGLVLLPKYEKHEGIKPEELLNKVISPERYIKSDVLAERLINKDPSILLIDVRDSLSYSKYTLPNAVNIPIKNMFDEEFDGYLDQNEYEVVLFSNDNLLSDQVWILGNRLGYKNLHVLKGGLNEWYQTIINPQKPTEEMPKEAYDLYTFRKASSKYFGVGYKEDVIVTKQPVRKIISKPVTKKVITVKKKKKAPTEGGC